MNRQIRFVGIGLLALFVVLFVQLNYLQVVHAPALDHNGLNGEQVVKQYNLARGAIISSDGVTLADSTKTPTSSQFRYQRHYPSGSLFGQITGYYSFIYGSDGVESTYNSVLTGAKHRFSLPRSLSGIGNLLTNATTAQNVTLTLSARLQRVARTELAGRVGSVVAIDPTTGGILAMYSNPTYDPTGLASLSTTAETKAWKRLLTASGQPLLPGSYRGRWFPGSTFKTITSAAVYDHKPALATHVYPTLGELTLPQTTNKLHNFANEVCGGALPELFTVSCDTGFGQVGLDLGAANLVAEAKAFGFDATPPLDLPSPAASNFPGVSSFDQNLPTLAFSALGQEDVSATPLEMALVAAGLAHGGRIMTPHVLSRVTDAQNNVVSTYKPSTWLHATSPATAKQLTTLMESVVDSPNGTGALARIPGVEVAAKTGTAQTGTIPPKIDAWFMAFAPAADPSIAVAVVLPNQPSANEYQGGTLAAPIAKAMIQAALNGRSAPGAVGPTTTTTTTSPHTTTPTTSGRPAPSTTLSPITAPATTPPATAPPATTPPPATTTPTTARSSTTTTPGTSTTATSRATATTTSGQ